MNKPLRVPNQSSHIQQIDLTSVADRGSPQTGTDFECARGLAYFADLISTDCAHIWIATGHRLSRERLQSARMSKILGELKAVIKGAHVALKFGTNASRCLFGAFACRFNRRAFDPASNY